MNSVIFSKKKQENDLVENPLYILQESRLIIKHKKGKNVFNISQVSNLRILKNRKSATNIYFLLGMSLFGFFGVITFEMNLIIGVLSVIVFLIAVFSFFFKRHTYDLLINVHNLGFRKFRLSKNEISPAKELVSIYKTLYFEKNNEFQNKLDFESWKQS